MFDGRTLNHQSSYCDGDAVQVVDLAVGEALGQLVHLALLVLDLEVDLGALGVAHQRRDELGHGFFASQRGSDLDHGQQRAVGVVVVPKVVVAGELAAEDALLVAQGGLHEGVADALADGDAAALVDVLGTAREERRSKRRACPARGQQLAADQGGHEVAADRLALLVHEGGAVGVSVEGDPRSAPRGRTSSLEIAQILQLERDWLRGWGRCRRARSREARVDPHLLEQGLVDRSHAVGCIDATLSSGLSARARGRRARAGSYSSKMSPSQELPGLCSGEIAARRPWSPSEGCRGLPRPARASHG